MCYKPLHELNVLRLVERLTALAQANLDFLVDELANLIRDRRRRSFLPAMSAFTHFT